MVKGLDGRLYLQRESTTAVGSFGRWMAIDSDPPVARGPASRSELGCDARGTEEMLTTFLSLPFPRPPCAPLGHGLPCPGSRPAR